MNGFAGQTALQVLFDTSDFNNFLFKTWSWIL